MKNKKFLIGGVIIGLAIILLAYMGFQGGNSYYFTVAEAIEQRDSVGQKQVRIQGEVATGFESTGAGQNLFFTLLHIDDDETTQPGSASIDIYYTGVIPNNFEAGRHVVVEGHFADDGSFTAAKIITACASKYESA
ncbi:MAG: cytochrome c maturation protein CcmE [Dehalococcoidales bacterium]|nr:cytochrome c maturation protein CcmE [Dehalococcoidales bacterium]MDD5605254.1 cytochrome c maturation protein CcmE [Dehalococcoidales bacterium]MDX9986551.1 cytochrome c maturation protein CcmE [Dehalococcoidales bacterium]NLE90342.1 cytochrome c maturation protein CcmE [Dehalococcoidales bacterium]